jgi:hypothetical protein
VSSSQDDFDDPFASPAPKAQKAKPPLGGSASAGESRKEARVKVKWMARVQLPDSSVVELRVCDISEGGIGLAGEMGIPANAVLTCAVAVPGLDDPLKITSIVGTLRTTHTTVRGLDLLYGGTWISIDADARDLLKQWIRRLR